VPFPYEHIIAFSLAQVFATVIQLLFAVDKLNFDKCLDHVETFAGAMSVTKAEWLETRMYLVAPPTAFLNV